MNHPLRFARTFLAPLAVAVSIGLAAAPGARASILQYDFSPDASMTVDGAVISISGSFDFDTVALSPSSLDVTLTFGGNSEVLDTLWGVCSNDSQHLCGLASLTNDFAGIAFSQSLALDAVDPLTVDGTGGCDCTTIADVGDFYSAVSGNVSPSTVPEPPALAILAAAFGLYGFARRVRPSPKLPIA